MPKHDQMHCCPAKLPEQPLTCRCHAKPPQLHGPYWQWTAKVEGKTVTLRLTPEQARLYKKWIDDRQLRSLIERMRQIAANPSN